MTDKEKEMRKIAVFVGIITLGLVCILSLYKGMLGAAIGLSTGIAIKNLLAARVVWLNYKFVTIPGLQRIFSKYELSKS